MLNSPTPPEAPLRPLAPVVVKKYANRRLYNTESSSYITLDNLADMVRAGRDFVVFDAKSGDDITRGVLTQIIVEEESKGRALLPTGFLRQLIGFYGDSMQGLVPRYLENAMTVFGRQQQQMRTTMQQTVGNLFPGMEEIGRQNMAMMERAMSLFAPFYRPVQTGEPDLPGSQTPEEDSGSAEINALRAEVAVLRSRLEQAQAEPGRPDFAKSDPTTTPTTPAKADIKSRDKPLFCDTNVAIDFNPNRVRCRCAPVHGCC